MVAINRQVLKKKRWTNPYREMPGGFHPSQILTQRKGFTGRKLVIAPFFSLEIPDEQQVPGKPIIINEPGRPFGEQPVDRG